MPIIHVLVCRWAGLGLVQGQQVDTEQLGGVAGWGWGCRRGVWSIETGNRDWSVPTVTALTHSRVWLLTCETPRVWSEPLSSPSSCHPTIKTTHVGIQQSLVGHVKHHGDEWDYKCCLISAQPIWLFQWLITCLYIYIIL